MRCLPGSNDPLPDCEPPAIVKDGDSTLVTTITAHYAAAALEHQRASYLDLRVPERPAAGGLESTDTAATTLNAQPAVQTSQ